MNDALKFLKDSKYFFSYLFNLLPSLRYIIIFAIR